MNENKLYLYKYYKQATIGDINIEEPSGWFNFEAKEKQRFNKIIHFFIEKTLEEYLTIEE